MNNWFIYPHNFIIYVKSAAEYMNNLKLKKTSNNLTNSVSDRNSQNEKDKFSKSHNQKSIMKDYNETFKGFRRNCKVLINRKILKYTFTAFFIIICSMIFFNTQIYDKNNVVTFNFENEITLPVIMYHNMTKKQNIIDRYCVSVKQFEEDLKYIKKKGYNCITSSELIDYVYNGKKLPENPFIITFDDGYESFYTYAYPLLKKYNMKAIMSIVGGYTDLFSDTEDHNVDYSHLNWKQVNELNNTDFIEIQNHTYNLHEITPKRKGAAIAKGESFENFKNVFKKDVSKLNDLILNYTGKKAKMFTYPYGNITEGSVEIIKELGFLGAFTCTEQVNFITGVSEELYSIGRFNRDGRISTKEFFNKISKNLEAHKK